jgi:hypothetical protein
MKLGTPSTLFSKFFPKKLRWALLLISMLMTVLSYGGPAHAVGSLVSVATNNPSDTTYCNLSGTNCAVHNVVVTSGEIVVVQGSGTFYSVIATDASCGGARSSWGSGFYQSSGTSTKTLFSVSIGFIDAGNPPGTCVYTWISTAIMTSSGTYDLGCASIWTGESGCQVWVTTGYATVNDAVNSVVIVSVTSTSVTSTATESVNCHGACDHTRTGGLWLVKNRLELAYGQNNVVAVATAVNLTTKIEAIKTTTATPILYMGIWSTTIPNAFISVSNPLKLVYNKTVSLTNATTNISASFDPRADGVTALVCGGCYFAIGLYTTNTASRGGGAANSGIEIYEPTTTTGLTWQFVGYSSSQTALPTFITGSIGPEQSYYEFIKLQYSVSVITVTSTASGTVSVTSTITSTTLDANLAATSTVGDVFMLLVILLPAFALMLPVAIFTRSPQATGIALTAGLMIGTGIGVQAGLVPVVFMGIMVVVVIFLIVGLFVMSRKD